jgi:hypothetical protein
MGWWGGDKEQVLQDWIKERRTGDGLSRKDKEEAGHPPAFLCWQRGFHCLDPLCSSMMETKLELPVEFRPGSSTYQIGGGEGRA